MASKNGLDPGLYLPDFPPDADVPAVEYRIDARQDVARFAWSTDPATVRTIEEFVDLAARLCVTANAIEIVDSREGQPPPATGARRVLFDLEAVCAERLALIDSLDRTCAERLEVIGALQQTCDERLELIAALQQTCTERLQLIAELQEACNERLATIRRLERAARGDQLEVGTASGG